MTWPRNLRVEMKLFIRPDMFGGSMYCCFGDFDKFWRCINIYTSSVVPLTALWITFEFGWHATLTENLNSTYRSTLDIIAIVQVFCHILVSTKKFWNSPAKLKPDPLWTGTYLWQLWQFFKCSERSLLLVLYSWLSAWEHIVKFGLAIFSKTKNLVIRFFCIYTFQTTAVTTFTFWPQPFKIFKVFWRDDCCVSKIRLKMKALSLTILSLVQLFLMFNCN